MANATPLSGATDAAGGILLTQEQGGILTKGVLAASGALAFAGDSRTTGSRQSSFAIWNGTPTAEVVGEGGTKPVTGAEFAGGTLNIKKIATIVTFTDEMLEDAARGDLNILVDGGVKEAIAKEADANAVGKRAGTNITGAFDSEYSSTAQTVEWDSTKQDGFSLAVSAAMGSLEANGYGDLSQMGILYHPSINRVIRDARITGVSGGGTASASLSALSQGLYQSVDPFYGLQRFESTNLNTFAEAAGANKVVAVVGYRPNAHVRIRHDVRVRVSNEASVGGTSLYQNDLTGARYVWRGGLWVHDLDRAFVAITNGS